MKAVSLYPEWAMMVSLGLKTVECRSWETYHRGDLLVCSSSRRRDGFVSGHALCVVRLYDVVPFHVEHLEPAMMERDELQDDCLAWCMSDVRMVRPFPVRGRLGLYDVPDDSVEVLGAPSKALFEKFYRPLIHHGRGGGFHEFWRAAYEELGWA